MLTGAKHHFQLLSRQGPGKLEPEDVGHRCEQLVRGLYDEIHRIDSRAQLACAAARLARSIRAKTYLSETPTSPKRLSTTTTFLVRFSPVSLSGRLLSALEAVHEDRIPGAGAVVDAGGGGSEDLDVVRRGLLVDPLSLVVLDPAVDQDPAADERLAVARVE